MTSRIPECANGSSGAVGLVSCGDVQKEPVFPSPQEGLSRTRVALLNNWSLPVDN